MGAFCKGPDWVTVIILMTSRCPGPSQGGSLLSLALYCPGDRKQSQCHPPHWRAVCGFTSPKQPTWVLIPLVSLEKPLQTWLTRRCPPDTSLPFGLHLFRMLTPWSGSGSHGRSGTVPSLLPQRFPQHPQQESRRHPREPLRMFLVPPMKMVAHRASSISS